MNILVLALLQLVNGSFEDGFAGWTVNNIQGTGGVWAVVDQSAVPAPTDSVLDHQNVEVSAACIEGLGKITATDGDKVVLGFQIEEASSTLTQQVTLPADARTLRWDMMYLSGTALGFDQGIAVGVTEANEAAPDTTYVFLTSNSTPKAVDTMTEFSGDISAFAGKHVIVHFENVAPNSCLPLVIDNVRIEGARASGREVEDDAGGGCAIGNSASGLAFAVLLLLIGNRRRRPQY